MTMLHYVCLCSDYRKIVNINMLFSIVHQVFWVLSKQDKLKMVGHWKIQQMLVTKKSSSAALAGFELHHITFILVTQNSIISRTVLSPHLGIQVLVDNT